MIEHIDHLVRSYERGGLTRRQLLQALAVVAAPAAARAQAPEPVASGRNLHHINLQVSDLARSEAFYRQLFDLGPTRVVQGPDNHGFDLPGGGRRLVQRVDGYRYTVVAGAVTFEDGEPTGARPGTLVRGRP